MRDGIRVPVVDTHAPSVEWAQRAANGFWIGEIGGLCVTLESVTHSHREPLF